MKTRESETLKGHSSSLNWPKIACSNTIWFYTEKLESVYVGIADFALAVGEGAICIIPQIPYTRLTFDAMFDSVWAILVVIIRNYKRSFRTCYPCLVRFGLNYSILFLVIFYLIITAEQISNYMDKTRSKKEVARESLIALSYTEPEKVAASNISSEAPLGLRARSSVKKNIDHDVAEKYRSELISISDSQSPDCENEKPSKTST